MNDPQSPQAKPPSNRAIFAYVLSGLSLLIAFVAISASLLNLKLLNHFKTETHNTQQQLLLQINQQQQDFREKLLDRMDENESKLNQAISQNFNVAIQQSKITTHYLIYLAKLNLTYLSDIPSAIQLLQLAAEQLTNIPAENMTSLKQKINADIEMLQKLPNPQLEILATIDRMIQQVNQIPLIQPPTQTKTLPQPIDNHSWKQKIKESFAKIKSFIVIRKIDNANHLAFSPDEKLLSKQFLLLKLTLAEWALLNREPRLYQQSLQAANTLLQSIPIAEATQKELMQTIQQLLNMSFLPKNIQLLSEEEST